MKQKFGKVFTPEPLAKWVAGMILEHLPKIHLTVLDPACGEGELLRSLASLHSDINIYGLDIDESSIEKCKTTFSEDCHFHTMDTLIPDIGTPVHQSFRKRDIPTQFDCIFQNPPWGANIEHTQKELENAGYKISKGQYDSWDLFIELSLKLLRPEGIGAFIIPDSIFLPEHEKVRQLLTEHTTILIIARLGEGFFKDVYRGTTVILVKNDKPSADHKIEIVRLNSKDRKRALMGQAELDTIRQECRFETLQKRFSNNDHFSWDIDVTKNDETLIRMIRGQRGNWTDYFETGRGVEINKKGVVLTCPTCGFSRPIPKNTSNVQCESCGFETSSEHYITRYIIKEKHNETSDVLPFVAGENVDRYRLQISKEIMLNVPGINYKKISIYSKPRILIRKTGVGIKATLANKVCATNQVVFHYIAKPTSITPSFYQTYVLGVLCSRVLFAYHLKVSGENEWRSHPYITQKTISRLPIPTPKAGTHQWDIARRISRNVKKLLTCSSSQFKALDIKIESLVANLYGFDDEDMYWVENVIKSAQEMEPMKNLNDVDYSLIKPSNFN